MAKGGSDGGQGEQKEDSELFDEINGLELGLNLEDEVLMELEKLGKSDAKDLEPIDTYSKVLPVHLLYPLSR